MKCKICELYIKFSISLPITFTLVLLFLGVGVPYGNDKIRVISVDSTALIF